MDRKYKVGGYVKLAKLWERSKDAAVAYHSSYYAEKFRDDADKRLVGVYIDITGNKEIYKRPEMVHLLKDCKNGSVNLIFSQTRAYLAANTCDFCFLLQYLFDMPMRVDIVTDDDDQRIDTILDVENSFWNYSGTNVTLKGTSVGGEANLRRVVSVEDGTVFNEGTEAEDVLVAELNPAVAGAGSSYHSDNSMSASVAEDAHALYGKVLRLKRTTTGSREGGRSYSLSQLKTADGQNLLEAGKKYRFVYSVKGFGEWGIQTSQTGWYGCLPESTDFKVGAVSYTAGSGSSCNLMITGESLTSGMWLDLEWLRIYEVK